MIVLGSDIVGCVVSEEIQNVHKSFVSATLLTLGRENVQDISRLFGGSLLWYVPEERDSSRHMGKMSLFFHGYAEPAAQTLINIFPSSLRTSQRSH
jgi:hypothetical protein